MGWEIISERDGPFPLSIRMKLQTIFLEEETGKSVIVFLLPSFLYLLICLLRNLYAGQEAAVKTGHGTTDWFQMGKGICQGCRLSPCLFNLYAEYIMRNAGLEETQAGIKGEISITSDMQMTPPLWQKVKKS